MFTQFLTLQRPDSTRANPAFMKKTRNAAARTQTVSRFTFRASRVRSMGRGGKEGIEGNEGKGGYVMLSGVRSVAEGQSEARRRSTSSNIVILEKFRRRRPLPLI